MENQLDFYQTQLQSATQSRGKSKGGEMGHREAFDSLDIIKHRWNLRGINDNGTGNGQIVRLEAKRYTYGDH
jgi:hypothetical protein